MNKYILLLAFMALNSICLAGGPAPFISPSYTPGSFPIVHQGKVPAILLADDEWPGVVRAAGNLQKDVEKVTGILPAMLRGKTEGMAIIIGTIGKSKLIDQLVADHKINVAGISGKWESTLIEVVKHPLKGVDSALVIAGSDKRGTIYGIYELSYQIGVSPWYYWADVPVKKSTALFAVSGRHVIASPAVKYRGIFLNDEAPALSGWSRKEFGGFNHLFYDKVFELILRLKGNYLWPAMWGSAFNDDDRMNPVLADEAGVVIGTSHHEPLSRAHDEWKRYKGGKWNYDQNAAQLREFWETGLKRVADKEQIITVGMRGDGDEPMTEGTATALLEKIVKDQREIISKVTGKPAAQTPQLWALYKEVQAYYDNGMRVPDDVTLLLCDDNWGNIRKLPRLDEAPRSGGYGIYYHFDYVGDPRNYKWINTNPIQKIWEQMNLAYTYNANQIWIVNVGDLKPMEFPIEFFLDYAWAPEAIPAERLKQYTIEWSEKQFGSAYAEDIADIIHSYSKYNGRIKPELLNENTYSLVNYNEFQQVVSDYKNLEKKAAFIYKQLPEAQRDAFYQLVLHPVEASANLNELYYTVAKNKMYAKQGRILTNALAVKADSLYRRDAEITNYYHHTMANGKWNHMMDQTHIGYTYWQQPEANAMPAVHKITAIKPALGIAIEGCDTSWIGKSRVSKSFPVFDRNSNKSYYFELFNLGNGELSYAIKAPDYILAGKRKHTFSGECRVITAIDWSKAPAGNTSTEIIISGSDGSRLVLPVRIEHNKQEISHSFYPQNGYISMEAIHYSKAVHSRPVFWKTLEGYGKTEGGVMPVPVSSPEQTLTASTPHLEYEVFLKEAGSFDLNVFISPTIDFTGFDGLKFALSVDDGTPELVNISKDYQTEMAWRQSVADNIKIFKQRLKFDRPGKHTLKYWMVSSGVVLQKLVLDLGGLKPSFLGPPETFLSY
ncbi:glycosyl hydrolase 115 family protein [Pedobacter sp. AW31-3R]|uniref:glycosyl hydrolase 115 family protein n=1 Tax=Pedobacter sp. AW31-3R TaxID=3445781 RepID=UPI003F9FB9C6